MRIWTKFCVPLLTAFAFVIPAWATHKLSTAISLDDSAKIGNTTLKPGKYRVVVNPKTSEVQIMQDGQVMASVKGKLVTLKQKSPYTAVVEDKNQIREIDFSGKLRAIRVD